VRSVVVAVRQLGGSSGSPGIKFIGLKSLPAFADGPRRQSPILMPSKSASHFSDSLVNFKR
jgi:hypothetical protein